MSRDCWEADTVEVSNSLQNGTQYNAIACPFVINYYNFERKCIEIEMHWKCAPICNNLLQLGRSTLQMRSNL